MKREPVPFKIEKQYRIPGWNYSNNGYYFVTVCSQDRLNFFVGTDPRVCSIRKKRKSVGEINKAGEMIEGWWKNIPNKFPLIDIDEFVVMPNHIHGILIIKNNFMNKTMEQTHESMEQTHRSMEQTHESMEQTRGSVPTVIQNGGSVPTEGQNGGSVPVIDHNIFGNVELLGRVIQWFKTMTTNEYIRNVKENGWPKFPKRLWQLRYHDRVIRNEKEYWAIKKYIENNPKNWGKDKENNL
jgi:putative transposase